MRMREALTFMTMMMGACAISAPGVLIGPLRSEFGWNATDISAVLAIRFLLFGAIGQSAADVVW
ncbi:MAG TPA: hypothetical protein VGC40_08095 [Paenirhodobacter sp.]